MNKILKQTDYAYAAGYIDGDGCFYIGEYFSKERSSYRNSTAIIVSSTDKHVLHFFKQSFGGSVRLTKIKHDNSKSLYQYIAKKENGVDIARKIKSHLVEKHEEAELFIKFAKAKRLKTKMLYINQIKTLKHFGNLVSKSHKEEFEQFRNTVTPTKKDFAYLAGFIDAECSLGISKYKPKDKPNYVYKILLQCNNTKTPVFKWLLQRFGGHINFIDRRNHGESLKNQLCWRLSSKALSQILKYIYPFLKHKKPVCEALKKFYETTLANGGARHTESFRTQYAKIIAIRENIVSKVHQLNLKGIKTT